MLAPHKPIAPKVEQAFPLPPSVPGSIVGGPWMVDGNFKSAIYLRNGVETYPVTVTPVRRSQINVTEELDADVALRMLHITILD